MKKRIVILGSGESGTGAALLAKHLGYDVFVSDKGAIKEPYQQELTANGIAWEENQHSLDKILNATEIIKSPGIPEKSEVMQAVRARGINVIGEIELGYRHAGKCSIVAITGSNGKTTTTELTFHLLHQAGLNVRKGGNVGNSFARMVLEDLKAGRQKQRDRIFVLEMSSFQLDDIQQFRPAISMLLNITPDHLDRYEYKLENYARSKFRISMNQQRGDKFIYNGFDPIIAQLMEAPASGVRRIAIRKGFFKKGIIRIGKRPFEMDKGNLKGPHNMFNAACAIRAALLLGADPEKIQDGLNTFLPPAHRLEKVANIQGVQWINDSKATNVDSVYYALDAMTKSVIWIAGGTDKGNDYSVLFPLVKNRVKALICLGMDNEKLKSSFKSHIPIIYETTKVSEAVETGLKLGESGDVVLLSPACASFDLFKNYMDRGDQFKACVEGLKISN